MGLYVRIYNIVSVHDFKVAYKSGTNPSPIDDDTTFTLVGEFSPETTMVLIPDLDFNTQYWIKITDLFTGTYIVKNIFTHDGEAFDCYDAFGFSASIECEVVTEAVPTPQATTMSSTTPTPTPTPTNTVTAGLTSTPTPTSTLTPTVTSTLTVTPTITRSATPTPTITVTQTSTPTPTVTRTSNLTPTPTNTNTPTSTLTRTPTPSPTVGTTLTPTPTTTLTSTPTATPTPTITVTQTRTPTPTLTSTYTPSQTSTPVQTVTPTLTRTVTPTQSVTPTFTLTSTFNNVVDTAPTYTARTFTGFTVNGASAYYEYLPSGYNNVGNTQTYPLLIAYHGVGEAVNNSMYTSPPQPITVLNNVGITKLINNGSWPSSGFTVNTVNHKFIVIAPQYDYWPSAETTQTILDYLENNGYRIDLSRVYLTGLSAGGAGVWDFARASNTNANRVAAIVPVCGATAAYGNCASIRDTNLPVFATHNDADGIVSVTNTISWMDCINAAPAPNPLAQSLIWSSADHNAWDRTYNLSSTEFNGTNIFKWMLQYTR